MLQTLSWRACRRLRARRAGADPGRTARGADRPRAWSRSPPGECTIGAGADGFAYDNERPRHRVDVRGLPDRAHARSPTRRCLTFVEGGGYERREWWSRRGLGLEGGARHHATRRVDGGPARVAARRLEPLHPTGPSSTSPGSRPTPSPARTARASPPRPSGRRRRPGTRRRQTPGFIRGATERPIAGLRANLDQRRLRHRARRRLPRRRLAVRLPGHDRRRLGVDGERASTAIPASSPSPTASTRRSSSASDYRVLRGGSWATARASPRRRSATGTYPSAGRSSPACGSRGTRMTPDRATAEPAIDPASQSTRTLDGARALAGRRRARRADAPVQGAAAQALLRRPRRGAVRPHLRAARVLPDAHRARDPRARGEIVAATGAAELVELGSGTAEQDARAARRDARRRHARALRPGRRVRARWCATAPTKLIEEYPGLRVHGVIGDFERHLGARAGGRPDAHRRASSAARSATSRPARAGASCARSAGCSARASSTRMPGSTCSSSARRRRAESRRLEPGRNRLPDGLVTVSRRAVVSVRRGALVTVLRAHRGLGLRPPCSEASSLSRPSVEPICWRDARRELIGTVKVAFDSRARPAANGVGRSQRCILRALAETGLEPAMAARVGTGPPRP